MTEEMFGPYRLEGLIGRGGMGEVHRAFDTVRGRVVALKRLPAALAADGEFRARFRKESALAARLHEPHIIPIHDFGEIDGRLFIDMRLVDGADLAALLSAHGPLTVPRAVNVVAQVAAALDVAHREGLVHRDIKPGNVLVTPGTAGDGGAGEFVYVADFGIARAINSATTSLTATGATVGSIDYMAPERFTGGHGDHRVDVYALGCVLFEALTARKPFVVVGMPAMIHAHLSVPPPRPSDFVAGIPAALDAVVARAMAKDPGDRYPSAGALAVAARAAAMGPAGIGSAGIGPAGIGAAATVSGPIVVPTSPTRFAPPASGGRGPVPAPVGPRWPAPPTPGPPRRNRRGLVALAVVAAVLVALGGGALVYWLALANAPGQASPSGTAAASEIRTEPVRAAGDNPFMPSVGDDRSGVQPVANTGGGFGGDTPGLYGGTRNDAACDPDAMVAFLDAHPDEAAAWSGVQGISPAQIRSYVAGLTPVILRSDTAVTNHGFTGGRATVVPAVLQAGTAVLVDAFGVPRARCSCGNPLTEAVPVAEPRYVGDAWPGFSPTAVTTVQPSADPITEFTLVDPGTEEVFHRPAGSRGSSDRPDSPEGPTSVALYELPVTSDAVGPSGVRAEPGQTGVAGSDNTSFWAGCAGVPATTTFRLGGEYRAVTGSLTLIPVTPTDLVIDVRLLGDGRELESVSLRAGEQFMFELATVGVQQLTLSAQVVAGVCTPAPVGYGVAVGAAALR